MAEGAAGRDVQGRRLLIAVAIAFVPAAVVGLLSEKIIKDVSVKDASAQPDFPL